MCVALARESVVSVGASEVLRMGVVDLAIVVRRFQRGSSSSAWDVMIEMRRRRASPSALKASLNLELVELVELADR